MVNILCYVVVVFVGAQPFFQSLELARIEPNWTSIQSKSTRWSALFNSQCLQL